MHTLPPALAGMGSYPHFILYRVRTDSDGSLIKEPTNYQGTVVDAHDRQHWMPFEHAAGWAAHHGAAFGVAFVLSDDDPFFFIDIDKCLTPDGTWSPIANTLCEAFAGCAIEVSTSGRGLHILGSGKVGGEHRKKNAQYGIEFYTTKRFIALTGTHARGDVANTVRPELLAWLVEYYFKPRAGGAIDDWTTEPVAEWYGPTDDDDLIRRALLSHSAASVFGQRASFNDLWTANESVLALAYPSSTSDAYDRSSADMALASHLSFWTGKNCERVRRLMLRSGLVRDKWDRIDYLEETISAACGSDGGVCIDRRPEPLTPGAGVSTSPTVPTIQGAKPPIASPGMVAAVGDTVDEPIVAEAYLVNGSTYLSPQEQIDLFRGCVKVNGQAAIYTPRYGTVKREHFKMIFGGYQFVTDHENTKTTTDPWEAFINSRAVRHPCVDGETYMPDRAPGEIVLVSQLRYVNIYRPEKVRLIEGDAEKFLIHVRKLFPVERDAQIMLSYLAALVQHKGKKFTWAPVVQGLEGNGKSFFSLAAEYAVGRSHTFWPAADKLGSQFNGWMFGHMLYCVEDFGPGKNRDVVIETLKPMITGERLAIERKGIDQVSCRLCGNFLFNTNHKGAIRKTMGDRRYAVFYTPQQEYAHLERDGITQAYVSDLYDWAKGKGAYAHLGEDYGFAVIAHYLTTFAIPDEFNPATRCQRAPQTSATEQAISDSLGTVEQQILEHIAEDSHQGFCGGFVSGLRLKEFIDQNCRGVTITPNKRPELMRALGYIPHPRLGNGDGRPSRPVAPDMSRPVLYVKRESWVSIMQDENEIIAAYERANKGAQ